MHEAFVRGIRLRRVDGASLSLSLCAKRLCVVLDYGELTAPLSLSVREAFVRGTRLWRDTVFSTIYSC